MKYRYIPLESGDSVDLPLCYTIPIESESYKYNFKMLICRLITGNLDIRCNSTGNVIKSRNNFTVLGGKISYTRKVKNMHKYFDIDRSRFEIYLSRPDVKNRHFYEELFMELARWLWLTEQENYLGAFVHSYRVLEKVSMVLPLVWSSKSKDYSGAFKDLKGFFGDDKSGELKFLERFIESFIDKIYLDAPCKINLTSLENDWRKSNYNTILHVLQSVGGSIASQSPHNSVTIPYRHLLQMEISLRNKYFHRLTGVQGNIGFSSVPDPDTFFGDVNLPMTNWLIFIISQVISFEAGA